jgi:hypothetical protein
MEREPLQPERPAPRGDPTSSEGEPFPAAETASARDQAANAGETASGDGAAVPTVDDSSAPTGNQRVDDAVATLSELDALEVTDHPARYEEIHRSLARALDEAPAEQAEPRRMRQAAEQAAESPAEPSATPSAEQSPHPSRTEQ